jgi:hypothetical protein
LFEQDAFQRGGCLILFLILRLQAQRQAEHHNEDESFHRPPPQAIIAIRIIDLLRGSGQLSVREIKSRLLDPAVTLPARFAEVLTLVYLDSQIPGLIH